MPRPALPPPAVLAVLAALGAEPTAAAAQAAAPQRLAFVSARFGDEGVYVVRADGGGLTRLTDHTLDRSPRWSPDGQRLAFLSSRIDADEGDLSKEASVASWHWYVVPAGGGPAELLLETPAYALRWSPDGRRLAFMSGFEDRANDQPTLSPHSASIYVTEPGEPPRRLCPIEGHHGPFAWSRDGSRLLYVANPRGSDGEGDWDVFVMNADGSGRTNLTSSPARDTDPVWSADERRIVFRSDRAGEPGLYTMDASGGQVAELPRISPFDTPLFCAPDDRIVLAAATAVWVMDFDGGNARQVAVVDIGFAALRDGDVDLSPDGKTLAYVTRSGIHTVPLDGGTPTMIVDDGSTFHLAYAPE